jgi:hypothetical protein
MKKAGPAIAGPAFFCWRPSFRYEAAVPQRRVVRVRAGLAAGGGGAWHSATVSG